MFNLGMGELLIILVIALLFLGPSKLPEVASSLGKAIRSFRKATSDLKDSLEVDDSIKAPIRELKAALRDEPVPVKVPAMSPQPPVAQTVPLSANLSASAPAPTAPPAAPAVKTNKT